MGVYFKTNDINDCCGCGACVNICPKNAISMQKDEYGYDYPRIDQSKCIECKLCTKVCEQIGTNNSKMPLKAFAGSHRNKEILKKSSSGGVFSALAEYFLTNGGAVCGCIFDDNLNAVHICTEKESDFLKIRKSKYLQSNVGFIYREIKKRLQTGQLVLFTGTPCQVAALYAVVGRHWNNLTTMDLICHGVPSQLLFNRFLQYLETKHKTKIIDFDFRSKKYGWKRFSMEFTDINHRIVNIGKAREFYIPAFTGGNTIRSACLACKYACPNRIGDITVGDFWGYEKVPLKCDTSWGTSAFTLNTENAIELFDILRNKLVCTELDYSIIVRGNTCLRNPTPRGEKREMYMDALKENKITEIAQKYRKTHRKKRIAERIRHTLPIPVFNFIRKIIS